MAGRKDNDSGASRTQERRGQDGLGYTPSGSAGPQDVPKGAYQPPPSEAGETSGSGASDGGSQDT
ncbi:hypothetical protein [Candidatus Poriferisodalis sp.]|uniref:hypothetical protein n=1 Tax=Candidatus Poriferisodalis sp. TaxID=3101277 RepID=UPI003B5B2C57